MLKATYAAAAAVMLCATPATAGTGTAEFFGLIRAAGTIAAGSGVSSSGKFGVGNYRVFFPRNVDTCVVLVTPISDIAHKAVAKVTSADRTRVLVNIFVNAATRQDVAFNILVKCQD